MSSICAQQARAASAARACARHSGRIALGALALALWLLAFASPVLADPPTHLRTPDLDLIGAAPDPGPTHPTAPFNHACGTAVDSEGDVYVASAGNDVVDIFNPAHEYLTSIANANDPCGLAVDSTGRLYVSESATGNVVKYVPNAYPFTGTPTYSAPSTIDSSGEAQGIAVDPFDDRLFVARGGHVEVYNSNGTSAAQNEVQSVFISATGGTYTLSFEGQTTTPLAFDATSAQVRVALEALSTIGPGNVSVATGGSGFPGDHIITFVGALANTQVPQLTGNGSALTGPGFGLIARTTTQGFSGRIGEGELSEATGVAAYTPVSDSSTRYVFAADAATDEIEIFGGNSLATVSPRQAVDGSDTDAFKADETPDNGMGFGVAGAHLAVDLANGHVLVYDAAHGVVDEFEATGEYVTQIVNAGFADAEPTGLAVFPQRTEVQRLATRCEGGTFTLTFGREGETDTTDAIPCDTPANKPGGAVDSIQEYLEELTTIGGGNVAVRGRRGNPLGSFVIAFVNELGNRDVDEIVADGSGLTDPFATFASISTEVQGSGPGRIYVTAGTGSDAKVLTFAPLATPGRAPRKDLSFSLPNAKAVAVDFYGNRYVIADASIEIYAPDSNTKLTQISDPNIPLDLAVDSECNLYVLDDNDSRVVTEETVVYYTPSDCPPKAGTTYSMHGPVAGPTSFATNTGLHSVAVDPMTDHVFVTQRLSDGTIKLDSASNGSGVLDPKFAAGLVGGRQDIDVCGSTGTVYISGDNGTIVYAVNPAGTEILTRITGKGSPRGPFGAGAKIAVNQANCHLGVFENERGVAEEYESSGAFVGEFGSFSPDAIRPFQIAFDNSCSVHRNALNELEPLTEATTPTCAEFDSSYGNAYVAFDDTAPGTFDLTAFGPLSYELLPLAVTEQASEVGEGEATLNGTVNPIGSDLDACYFEFTTEVDFQANGFSLAEKEDCVESLAEIGNGTSPVAVHAQLSGLDPEERYRFRLVAENAFGTSEGDPGVFGPPEASTDTALPISYGEATLRGSVDPVGLATDYYFEYGKTEAYGQVTATKTLAATAAETDVAVPAFGLEEGETYHFRIVAESEAGTDKGLDESLTTLRRLTTPPCVNDEFRTGRSASLPDCRAYELVTPPDTRGLTPEELISEHQFANWMVAASGIGAGERVSYFVEGGTLPGFDGNGGLDGYLSRRAPGLHPENGWESEVFSPSYAEAGAPSEPNPDRLPPPPGQEGIAPDQEYSIWTIPPVEGTLGEGTFLRAPAGFEPLGQGSLGTDLDAFSHYVSAGGAHVIFSSKAHLEPDTPAAAANTNAIYERAAGQTTAKVVSLKPGNTPFGSGENAAYLGSTEDGEAIAFKVGGTLYLRQNDETVEIAEGPNTFAGISADGTRVFYVDNTVVKPIPAAAGLWVFDTETLDATEIAADSRFVNVSSGGRRVYFTSTEVLDDALEGTLDEDNLYVWDESSATTRFVAGLAPEDFLGFAGPTDNLVSWTDAISDARGHSPTRSTPDGSVFVFQSYAQLTSYDNTEATASACGDPAAADDRCPEVYLYDGKAAAGQQLVCVSCDPTGAPPTGAAMLQDLRSGSTVTQYTIMPNVTEDGRRVFFQSDGPLLPEDANEAQDVYEWLGQGAGGCEREGGCLALISSGQSERDSFLYGMSVDGHDVFFSTNEKLVGADIPGSPSIYDARKEGGIPDPPVPAPCQGDACQGQGSLPPTLPSPGSVGSGDDKAPAKSTKCPKGKRKVKRRGKVRCVAKHHKQRHRHRQANRNRGGRR
jgi:hypothetical protein